MRLNRLSLAGLGMVLGISLGCSGAQPAPCPACPPQPYVAPEMKVTAQPPPAPPTVEEAKAFISGVDTDLRKIWLFRDRTSWVQQNFINDDTEDLASKGEEESMDYLARKIREAKRFDSMQLPEDVGRQLMLLKLAGSAPPPDDAKDRTELAKALTTMTSLYGTGKYCPERLKKAKKTCLELGDLEDILSKSRKYDELQEAWVGWHAIAPPIRPVFQRYVELSNKGARDVGFKDMGAMWRAGYDMPPEQFEAEVERLWQAVKPLYDDLHCYVRARLRKHYGADKVPEKGPIPAHLLGNMWAQEWEHVYDLVAPYPKEPAFDATKKLMEKNVTPHAMVEMGERFFKSLGFDPLPTTFWDRSLLAKPRDRSVVCHASAWDIGSRDDLRIKMCIKPTGEDLVTIHHELGHIFYYSQYYKLPILFQQGANDGFHEGIGDTIALSVTPKYLKDQGLLDQVPSNENARVNHLMMDALDKVAFLPFGLVIDKWRWDVLSGKIPADKYNSSWWELRTRYQGVAPPVARSEADFDPGAKYHIPGNTAYVRYFLARILQFQFHRALCKLAGHKGSLDSCSIYGNTAAGEKLRAMLSLGASKPWPEALAVLQGEKQMDPSAMLEYFAPLRKFLQEQNKGQTCGW